MVENCTECALFARSKNVAACCKEMVFLCVQKASSCRCCDTGDYLEPASAVDIADLLWDIQKSSTVLTSRELSADKEHNKRLKYWV